MGEVTGEGFDVSAGFGSGREGGGGAVTGGIRVAVAARKVSFILDQVGQRRVGVEFFPPRIRFGSGIVVGVGIPYARTGLGDAGALFVARMPGDAFQCLLADGVGERILFRGAGIEKYDDFEASVGDTGLRVGHVGESTEKGFDGRCPFVQVVEVVHG